VAETTEEVPGAGGPNRTLLWIMLTIGALFLIGGLTLGPKKSEPPKEPPLPPGNARALVVPSDDARRTVVIAPCGTDPAETARQARQNESTPNSIRFDFPREGGDRAVMVPDCSPQAGVSGANKGLPAAALVLPVGTKERSLQMPFIRAESQAIVPAGSEARTIVISPCTGELGGEAGRPAPSREGGQNQDAVLEPEEGEGSLVTAPKC
jgi:hypothetical protein